MAIVTYGCDSQYHNVISVEVIEGELDGHQLIVINQLVETDRDDYNFSNGRFIMKHHIDLFPVAGDTIGQIVQTGGTNEQLFI